MITKAPNTNTWQKLFKEIIITYKGWTVVRAFNNSQKQCKNNGRIVWSYGTLRTESVEVILSIPFSMT